MEETKQLPAEDSTQIPIPFDEPACEVIVKPKLLPVINKGNGGKVIISHQAMHQIHYLLRRFPKNEWSGIMVYRVIEGDLTEPYKVTFYVEYVFLKDIGHVGYTEYDNDGDTMKLFDAFPKAMDEPETYRMGMIHSHHEMAAYFSGTDMAELAENAPQHLYYLSLIVSHNPRYAAKLAFVVESIVKRKDSYKNIDDSDLTVQSTDTVKNLFIYDMTVVQRMDEGIEKRIEEVNEIKKANAKIYPDPENVKKDNRGHMRPNKREWEGKPRNTGSKDLDNQPSKIEKYADMITNSMADQCLRYMLTSDALGDITEMDSLFKELDKLEDTAMRGQEVSKIVENTLEEFFDNHLAESDVEAILEDIMGDGKKKIPLSELALVYYVALVKGVDRQNQLKGKAMQTSKREYYNLLLVKYYTRIRTIGSITEKDEQEFTREV